MIWGKTDDEKLKKWKSGTWFAWRPITLNTGRWCWLESLYWKRHYGWGGDWIEYWRRK